MSWILRDSICIHYFCDRCPLATSKNLFHKSCHKMEQSEIIESIRNGKLKDIKHGKCEYYPCEECREEN